MDGADLQGKLRVPISNAKHLSVRMSFILVALLAVSCSNRVKASDVLGSYKAVYPFGQSVLVLRRDGTFTQSVVVTREPPVSSRGTWSFDAAESKLTLRGAMALDDGFGHLNRDWRTVGESPSLPVERVWLRVMIEDSSEFPHVKMKR